MGFGRAMVVEGASSHDQATHLNYTTLHPTSTDHQAATTHHRCPINCSSPSYPGGSSTRHVACSRSIIASRSPPWPSLATSSSCGAWWDVGAVGGRVCYACQTQQQAQRSCTLTPHTTHHTPHTTHHTHTPHHAHRLVEKCVGQQLRHVAAPQLGERRAAEPEGQERPHVVKLGGGLGCGWGRSVGFGWLLGVVCVGLETAAAAALV
jgi:hypothetical protein